MERVAKKYQYDPLISYLLQDYTLLTKVFMNTKSEYRESKRTINFLMLEIERYARRTHMMGNQLEEYRRRLNRVNRRLHTLRTINNSLERRLGEHPREFPPSFLETTTMSISDDEGSDATSLDLLTDEE